MKIPNFYCIVYTWNKSSSVYENTDFSHYQGKKSFHGNILEKHSNYSIRLETRELELQ